MSNYSSVLYIFQSTPPCGGDQCVRMVSCRRCHFNPRPLAGATSLQSRPPKSHSISIHAPLRGRRRLFSKVIFNCDFNPRPLAGATGEHHQVFVPLSISIHAPLRGRRVANILAVLEYQFQSTPPCGGDLVDLPPRHGKSNFNPRPLAGATILHFGKSAGCVISIHAPLRGRHLSRR